MVAGGCPPNHVAYLSATVATNAVTLHHLADPGCTSIVAFTCGDHYHIGHSNKADGRRCKARSEAAWAARHP